MADRLPPTSTNASRRSRGPILGVLEEGKPLVLIIETTDDFTFPIDGLVAVPPAHAGDGAFHAVAVIGAAHTIDGTPWLRIRNSWGVGLGPGRLLLAPAGLPTHLRQLRVHCQARLTVADCSNHRRSGLPMRSRRTDVAR